ncbi:uncharacterized protein PHACADRAFT_213048 [Phanerochaete carnosa HHB-10118-sp]|uniref:Uncharacterized protein n=1 Tax=Phanerochaete carnosa (strain HHB-10118-sp) TaxID=650164 RepID=K5VX31_PHACS|nr:uncharacterized protein PHACADRAFT_213048 [Phanerochaete carnosa HHB-10118-sp]EKM51164.1 hypothetical protein PHACADRAFT_213048 [Phanerochaete carnosa HHB-10118-sp]
MSGPKAAPGVVEYTPPNIFRGFFHIDGSIYHFIAPTSITSHPFKASEATLTYVELPSGTHSYSGTFGDSVNIASNDGNTISGKIDPPGAVDPPVSVQASLTWQ